MKNLLHFNLYVIIHYILIYFITTWIDNLMCEVIAHYYN